MIMIEIMAVFVIVAIMEITEQLLSDMNFLSDVFIIENDYSIFYQTHESNYTDLENVSICIDFVKPITQCHIKNKTGFANLNKIKR